MRFKLDENLGVRGFETLRDSGHDVSTVSQQGLCSVSDETLAEVCRAEQRILVTLDLDFANILRFRPSRYAGLIVLRLGEPFTKDAILVALERIVEACSVKDPTGRLWIVDPEHLREYCEERD